MLKINVKEDYSFENMVEMFMDGELVGERTMSESELHSFITDAKSGNVEVEFEDDTEIRFVSIEEYDGEYDVVLNTFTYRTLTDFDYSDETVKTYKREASATRKVQEMASKLDCAYEI